jgi:thioredoxin 1
MLSPIVGQLSEQHVGEVTFFKLNADDNAATLDKYGVSSVPTLLVFKQGEVVHSITGAKPKAVLLTELADFL